MLLWMGDASVHELYTAACGLYLIWVVCRVGSVLLSWVPLGWKGVAGKFLEWFLLVSSISFSLLCKFRRPNALVTVTVYNVLCSLSRNKIAVQAGALSDYLL